MKPLIKNLYLLIFLSFFSTHLLSSFPNEHVIILDDEKSIKNNCFRCSVFIDAGTDLSLLENKNINAVEIFTGPYADAHKLGDKELLDQELKKLIFTAESAKREGLRVNAGHDLDLQNLTLLKELDLIDEVSIGHAIISESLDRGFKNTIQQYINLING